MLCEQNENAEGKFRFYLFFFCEASSACLLSVAMPKFRNSQSVQVVFRLSPGRVWDRVQAVFEIVSRPCAECVQAVFGLTLGRVLFKD